MYATLGLKRLESYRMYCKFGTKTHFTQCFDTVTRFLTLLIQIQKTFIRLFTNLKNLSNS